MRVHLAGAIRIAHRVVELLQLVMQVADAAAAENRFVEHRAAGHLLDVLAEVADRQLLRNRDVALVGHLFAGDHPEQGRLARSVRADEADLFAGIELEGGVDEQDLPAVLLADAGQRNHVVWGFLRVRAAWAIFSPISAILWSLEPLFVEPVRAGDFLEGVDGGLNAFGPGDGDQLDVAVHVADGENAAAAGFEVRIDGDAAVVVQPQARAARTFPSPRGSRSARST